MWRQHRRGRSDRMKIARLKRGRHLFHVLLKLLIITFPYKTMMIEIFSNPGFMCDATGTSCGHERNIVVVLFQKCHACMHTQTRECTLIMIPTDTMIHIWKNRFCQTANNRMLTRNPKSGVVIPSE